MNLKKVIVLFFMLIASTFSSSGFAFRFVTYGDSQAENPLDPSFNHDVLGYINSQIVSLNPKPDFVCFLGDSVNAPFGLLGENYLREWHEFMDATLMGIPYYVVPGNHDVASAFGYITDYTLQENYKSEFNTMPINGPPTSLYDHLIYFLEWGEGDSSSLLIFLNSYMVEGSGLLDRHYYGDFSSVVESWYASLLATSKAKHKFVLCHVPFFPPNGYMPYYSPADYFNGHIYQKMYYESKDVDFFFHGHVHVCSRWNLSPATTIKAPQIITGKTGAPPEEGTLGPSLVVPSDIAHIHQVNNFGVIDVNGKNVTISIYEIVDQGGGNFSKKLIDSAYLVK